MSLLLIPGFMLDGDFWRDTEKGLARFGPIRHVDLTRDDTLYEMARRALSHAPKSFILVGFSMGGYVAREILRQDPSRVGALILIATSARGDSDAQIHRRAAIEGPANTAAFSGLSRSAIAASLHPDHADRSDLIDRVQAMGRRLGAEVFRRQSLIERKDERHRLAEIHCPTLVVAGEQDNVRSPVEAIELHRGIANSSFAIIEKTGHMIPLEAPQGLVNVMTNWLDAVLPETKPQACPRQMRKPISLKSE